MIEVNAKISEFQKALDKSLKRIATDQEDFLKKISLTLLAKCQKRTPVKTGRARAGWYYEHEDKKHVVGNRVEYIVGLEYGKSKQAPQGMLRLSLDELKAQLP